MIKAEFFVDRSGYICGFHIHGHSMMAESGQDVLCAFVSSAAYMAANTITDVIGADAQAQDGDGDMRLAVAGSDLVSCQIVLAGLKLHLCETEKQYPNNLNVIITEV